MCEQDAGKPNTRPAPGSSKLREEPLAQSVELGEVDNGATVATSTGGQRENYRGNDYRSQRSRNVDPEECPFTALSACGLVSLAQRAKVGEIFQSGVLTKSPSRARQGLKARHDPSYATHFAQDITLDSTLFYRPSVYSVTVGAFACRHINSDISCRTGVLLRQYGN